MRGRDTTSILISVDKAGGVANRRPSGSAARAAAISRSRRAVLLRWAETEFGSQHDPETMDRSVAAGARGANPAGDSPNSSNLRSLAAQKPGPSPDYFQWLLKLQAAGQEHVTQPSRLIL